MSILLRILDFGIYKGSKFIFQYESYDAFFKRQVCIFISYSIASFEQHFYIFLSLIFFSNLMLSKPYVCSVSYINAL
jgi:hypothetical protein